MVFNWIHVQLRLVIYKSAAHKCVNLTISVEYLRHSSSGHYIIFMLANCTSFLVNHRFLVHWAAFTLMLTILMLFHFQTEYSNCQLRRIHLPKGRHILYPMLQGMVVFFKPKNFKPKMYCMFCMITKALQAHCLCFLNSQTWVDIGNVLNCRQNICYVGGMDK